MGLLTGGLGYIVSFLIVLTVLVFVHELGHYLVARYNGVRVEAFSFGFGPELFGWTDRAGTRWKFSALPVGGYVRMFGDADAASTRSEGLDEMTEAEKALSFHHKRLSQRAAVIVAGPAANFLFAIVALAAVFTTQGKPFTPSDIGAVTKGSVAEAAGIVPGDAIVAIDGQPIRWFEQIQQAVELNTGTPIELLIQRDGVERKLTVTPRIVDDTDFFGFHHHGARLGLGPARVEHVRYNPVMAVWHAVDDVWNMSIGTLKAVWQMIIGVRPSDVSGPFGMIKMAGTVTQYGVISTLTFMVVLSVNLGLVNLFPIPVLDGGHLLFYAAEALRGRPLGRRAQEYGLFFGLALVMTLMIFATWKDIERLEVIKHIKDWMA